MFKIHITVFLLLLQFEHTKPMCTSGNPMREVLAEGSYQTHDGEAATENKLMLSLILYRDDDTSELCSIELYFTRAS